MPSRDLRVVQLKLVVGTASDREWTVIDDDCSLTGGFCDEELDHYATVYLSAESVSTVNGHAHARAAGPS